MTPPAAPNRYKHYRFPADIISHGVWLYYRFCLSYRDVEELLFARGIIVTYETIRQWCRTFGQDYANQLRRRRPRPGDKWHLDEVFLTSNGAQPYLWRAVDQEGYEQNPQHSRRNALPTERINGPLVMCHEHLTCALIELLPITSTPSRSNGVFHRPPEAF